MAPRSLSALQWRLLRLLAGVQPRGRLTGGAALAGFHAGHRETRDLDVFWPPVARFDDVIRAAERVLTEDGLRVQRIQTAPTFARILVADDGERCTVDLVSDPTAVVDAPEDVLVDGARLLVDSPQEILTNKLCALLSRSELRDLIDTRWLVEHGADLDRAVHEAQRKDGGFSAAVLAWVLQGTDLDTMAHAADVAPEDLHDLRAWRDGLIDRLVALSRP